MSVATIFAASPAEAVDIDYDEATSAEIEDHIAELETERAETEDRLADLRQRLSQARAVIDEVSAEYGSPKARLDRVTVAVDSAEEDLGAKMASLVGFAKEQTDRFEEAQAATEDAIAFGADIAEAEAAIAELDEQIDEAEQAAEAAAEAEAQAEAEAAAEAAAAEAAASEPASNSDSGSSSDTVASYSSDAATAAVEFARAQLGEPYVYGAAGPDSWDCSGLVQGAYAVSGISLTHYTVAIWNETTPIDRSDLRPGDLVFYAGLGHMAIYIGGGEVIHAPKPGDVVKTAGIDMMGIDGYRRV
ncbi:C40 family peptidase [Glycomyces halotolerans]